MPLAEDPFSVIASLMQHSLTNKVCTEPLLCVRRISHTQLRSIYRVTFLRFLSLVNATPQPHEEFFVFFNLPFSTALDSPDSWGVSRASVSVRYEVHFLQSRYHQLLAISETEESWSDMYKGTEERP